MFGFQHVAPVLSKKLVAENGTSFTSTLNKVSALLTVQAMIAMNKAVALDKKPAAAVAKAFLQGERPELAVCGVYAATARGLYRLRPCRPRGSRGSAPRTARSRRRRSSRRSRARACRRRAAASSSPPPPQRWQTAWSLSTNSACASSSGIGPNGSRRKSWSRPAAITRAPPSASASAAPTISCSKNWASSIPTTSNPRACSTSSATQPTGTARMRMPAWLTTSAAS